MTEAVGCKDSAQMAQETKNWARKEREELLGARNLARLVASLGAFADDLSDPLAQELIKASKEQTLSPEDFERLAKRAPAVASQIKARAENQSAVSAAVELVELDENLGNPNDQKIKKKEKTSA